MNIRKGRETMLLFVGDVFFWTFALWLTLYLRYFEIPETHSMLLHASAFGFIFILWVIVFFIAGLYANQTLLVKSKIPATILRAQIANSIIAVFFFYFIPYFGLTPKTTLFLDLIISFGLVLLWRIYLFDHLVWGRRHRAVIIGGGNETKELCAEINNNPRYRLRVEPMDLRGDATIERLKKEKIRFVILNPRDDEVKYLSSKLSALMFSKVNFIDIHDIYEDIFGREPLSLINDNWFLENISGSQKIAYGLFKRIMDIGIAFCLGVASLIVYPIVYFAIKFEDGGPIFVTQERVGQNGAIIQIHKFRSMKGSDAGKWVTNKDPRITRVGSLMRKMRIDELPQLWNVLGGDLSLIGPRPELLHLVSLYTEEIPYYAMRHLIQPGLSGWAQIHHEKPPHSIEGTLEKISYDFYYIRNRSVMLDVKIALRTLKTLLSRSGV